MPSLSLLGAHLQGKENALATDKAFENYESQMKKTNISKFYWRFAIESVLAMVRTKRSYRRIGGNWGKLLELIDNDRARKRYAAATEKERKDLLLTKALNIVRQKEPSERTEEDIEVLFAAFPSLKRHSHDIHMASLLASELKLRKASQGEIIYGGNVQVEEQRIEPTIIMNPNLQSDIMTEEIFGPALPKESQRRNGIDSARAGHNKTSKCNQI